MLLICFPLHIICFSYFLIHVKNVVTRPLDQSYKMLHVHV